MHKEPTGPKPDDEEEIITPEEGLKRAESILEYFKLVLEDVEGEEEEKEEEEKRVDLDEISNTHAAIMPQKTYEVGGIWVVEDEKKTPLTKGQALGATSDQMKQYIGYLPQDSQEEARGLIIRAELYLADDRIKKEIKKKKRSKLK